MMNITQSFKSIGLSIKDPCSNIMGGKTEVGLGFRLSLSMLRTIPKYF